jgi:general secretion pathway protein J
MKKKYMVRELFDKKTGDCFVGHNDLPAMTANKRHLVIASRKRSNPMTVCGYQKLLMKSYGFTLLELLISIVMIAIIVLIIGGAMRLGFRSVGAGEKKIEALERVKASLQIIDAQIQSLIPLTYDEEGTKKSYFEGDKDSLQFSTNYSIWGGQRGYVVVSYAISSEEGSKPFLLASETIMGTEGTRETKLLNALDEIYFEYFYKDPTEEEGKWVEEWTDESDIPEKIRLHLVTGQKDLSFIIPVRVKESLEQASSIIPEEEAGEEE